MSYDGEVMNAGGALDIDLSRARVVAVSGDGPNVCGHMLLYAPGRGGGYYFHVAVLHGYPKYMSAAGYRRYLRESGKRELRRVPVPIPDPDAARRKLEELMSQTWTWLVVPNNCVAFVEEVIPAGGGTWASASNCPAVATAPTLRHRVNEFFSRLDGEIRRLYGVPSF